MANDYTLKEKGIIRADATKIYPSVDAMYGPWASVAAFRTYLGEILGGTVTDDIIPNSVEIGIIQSDGTVNRYEWQKPTNGEGQWISKSDSGGAVASVNGKTGAVVLSKSDIGLGNVDNTSDVNKPISTATQTALNAKANASDLTAHTGSTSNPHGVTKVQVGLGNVDNTADADKIVKRATEDGSGNVIVSTYETKTDAQSKITNLASDVADTYQTKTDSASAHTNLQSQITAIQTTVSNLTGLDGTNFGGFSIQQSDSLAVAGITTLYGQMGYTAGDVYWFLAGTSMASLKAYRFDGVQTDPVLISNDVYDFTDFSGLQTKVDKFKGTTNDIDSLNSGSNIGIYFYIGASKMGLVSVAYDATHSVVTQHWLSDMTPDSVDPNVLNEGPAILMRTYKNSAWSAWQNPIGELAANVAALGLKIGQINGEINFDVIDGSTINVSGTIVSREGAKRSDYIDVSTYPYIYVTNPNNAKLEFDVFYDSNKAYITDSRFEVPANATYQKIEVPSGAKYCIVSVRNNGDMPIVYKPSLATQVSDNTKSISDISTSLENLSPTRKNNILGNFYQNKELNEIASTSDLNDYYESFVGISQAGVAHAPNSTYRFLIENYVAPWMNGIRYTVLQKATSMQALDMVQYIRIGEITSSAINWSDWTILPRAADVDKTVRFAAQNLTTEQKVQARTNIGAANASVESDIAHFVSGDYINEGSINSLNTPGGYNVGASVTDKPATGVGSLFVCATNSRFIQKLYFNNSTLKLYFGTYDKNDSSMLIDWVEINKSPLNSTGTSTTDAITQKAATDYVDNPNRPTLTTGSVNSANKSGGYWVGADVTDKPEVEQGSLIVTPTFNNGRFIHKKFIARLTGNIYEQIYDTVNPTVPMMPWVMTNPRANIFTYGKNIVCFGDSLFGNYDGLSGNGEGVCSFMAKYGYATTYNCAFGGTAAALRGSTYWDAMCFVKLVDAIVDDDWTDQDYAIAHSTEFPAAFATHLATLKAVDWANVDIVTIEYGGNDYYLGEAIGDNSISDSTFTGALHYGIKKLQEEFPHIKVVLITTTWRWYKDSDGYYDHDSDMVENSINLKQSAYADASLALADILHIPCCDNYYKLGINKYNYKQYYPTGTSADGAHHNLFGRKTLAHRIVAFINANC